MRTWFLSGSREPKKNCVDWFGQLAKPFLALAHGFLQSVSVPEMSRISLPACGFRGADLHFATDMADIPMKLHIFFEPGHLAAAADDHPFPVSGLAGGMVRVAGAMGLRHDRQKCSGRSIQCAAISQQL